MLQAADAPLLIIDADSHVIEPPDVWTARVPRRYIDDVPHVELNPQNGHNHWRIGSKLIWPVGFFGVAGFDRYPPEFPSEYEDTERGSYDPAHRLKRLDEYGVDVQVLYPNIIGFEGQLILEELGPELALICTRAYNDFLVDWCSEDPSRLIPIAMLPWWSVDDSVEEMQRCVELGHRGVLFADKFERVGLPSFTDSHWDPIYQAAQGLDIPVNYHVGFTSPELGKGLEAESLAKASDKSSTDQLDEGTQMIAGGPKMAQTSSSTLLSQADVIGKLLTSGLCERFPSLKLVAVESGFGYFPFYLETLDWYWRVYGNPTDKLLPSEYFRRQCYGTFWFERTTLPLLEEFPDNFMFSTDYPHGSSLSPGPASPASVPSEHVQAAFKDIDPDLAAKAICHNATRLYKLDA